MVFKIFLALPLLRVFIVWETSLRFMFMYVICIENSNIILYTFYDYNLYSGLQQQDQH